MGLTKAQRQARLEREQKSEPHQARLQLASQRLKDAELERTWAIVAAHQDGRSIRDIARDVGL